MYTTCIKKMGLLLTYMYSGGTASRTLAVSKLKVDLKSVW